MSRIVKVSENNYRLVVQTGGTITFDTGYNVGVSGPIPTPANTVVITGDLLVLGETTTVNTTNLNVEDNIITLNVGEQSDTGVTEGTSGIQIQRSKDSANASYPDAQFIWDEDVSHYSPLTTSNVNGTFVFKTTNGTLQGIQTNSIVTGGTTNLVFDLKNSNNVLRIANNDATSYANRLSADLGATDHDNDIPNRKFVTNYVAASGGSADVSHIQYPASSPVGTANSSIQSLASSLRFAVGTFQRAQITATGLDVDDINTFGHTITSTGAYNLILTAANNNVEINAVLNLDDQAAAPSVPSGKTKVYSKSTAGSGRSGVYISNSTLTNISTWDAGSSSYVTSRDELVVKNRALLFSMIF